MSRKKYRIALVIDYILSEYAELLLDGIKSACKTYDVGFYILPIGCIHNIHQTYEYQCSAVTAFLNKNNVDGMIFVSGTQMHYISRPELAEYLSHFSDIPIVSIAGELPKIPSIVSDYEQAYEQLADIFVNEQGRKKFAILSVQSHSSEMKTRVKILRKYLEQQGIDSQNIVVFKTTFDYNSAITELESYYKTSGSFDFDGIIAANDELAFAGIDFCTQKGLRIPEDVAICGFDNLKRSRFSFPTLTTIDQNLFEQGQASVKKLVQILDGEKSRSLVTKIDSKLIIRESTHNPKAISEGSDTDVIKYQKNESNCEHYSATVWYKEKTQLQQLTRFYTEMQDDMTLSQLEKKLNSDLKTFGISAATIVLYDEPVCCTVPFDFFDLPQKASIVTSFDMNLQPDENESSENETKSSGKQALTVKFNPHESLLPSEKYINVDNQGIYCMSIYHNSVQYGYMLFRRGDYEIEIYDMLSKILSSMIVSVYKFTLAQTENIKITKNYKRLNVLSHTDDLTGLYNRRGLYDFGENMLTFAQSVNQTGIIIYSDMDGLKTINDTFGHEAGDRAILAQSIILKGNFRSNDIVARIGGDEFAVICPGLTVFAYEKIKRQIYEDCKKWTKDNGNGITLSISLGFVEFPSEKSGYQINQLLAEADTSLYYEKRNKKKSL